MSKMFPVSFVCFVFIFSFAARSQQSDLTISTPEEIRKDLQKVPCSRKERRFDIRNLFQKMGASPAEIDDKVADVWNISTSIPGKSTDQIVIGAHYDFRPPGCGAIDNWSGIVAINHLYRSIKSAPLNKSVIFVTFDGEEAGLAGSAKLVNKIPKDQLPRYCAMINIDSLGLANPFAMTNSSSPKMISLASEQAAISQIPFSSTPIPGADADSSSFRMVGIPAITLSGITGNWYEILHTKKDQQKRVNPASVYLGYRLALAVWNQIDSAPCEAFR